MNRLRLLWCVALLVSSTALAQSRAWKVPYEFRIGQMEGMATVVVRAVDNETNEVIAEDTVNVMVKNFHFSGLMSVGASDASSAQAMKHVTDLRVEYAYASAPETVIHTLRYGAPAYAMTLAPGAVITNNTMTLRPALNLSGSYLGLSARASGTGAALSAETTSPSGAYFSAAVEGVSASAEGAGGHFIHTGGGELIRASRTETITPDFSVDSAGTARTRGVVIPEFGAKGARGDKGDRGNTGDDGARGDKGPPGYPAPIRSFGIVYTGNTCVGVCKGRTVLVGQASVDDSACTSISDQGNVTNNFGSGVCCVCGPL